MSANDAETLTLMLLRSLRAPEALPPSLTKIDGWKKAFESALRLHGALPFLHLMNQAGQRNALTPEVLELLDRELTRERIRLALLDEELDCSLQALNCESIPVIVLKGMDLGRRYYPDRLLRPMTDVDLLVPRNRYQDAQTSLIRKGFRVTGILAPHRFRIELSRTEGSPVVELHEKLQPDDPDPWLSGLWQRSLVAQIPGLGPNVRALAPVDLAVYLIRHGAHQHLLESPIWLNDLRAIFSSPAFSHPSAWDMLLEEARGLHCQTATAFVLQLLRKHWSTPSVSVAIVQDAWKSTPTWKRRQLEALMDPVLWFGRNREPERSLLRAIWTRALLRDDWLQTLRHGIHHYRLRQN